MAADQGRIIICRDLPGDHPGGEDCWCCPGIFRADDTAGVERWLREQHQTN